MLLIRQPVRGAVESYTPTFIGAILGGLGFLSLDWTEDRQVCFSFCFIWFYVFVFICSIFPLTLFANGGRLNYVSEWKFV